jgi:uncharacterized protein
MVQVSTRKQHGFPPPTSSQFKIARRDSVSLRIMVGPDERCGDLSASDAIVQAAHHLHLAQPVVTGSMRGYRRLFARLLGIDQSAPVIVEIIDARAKLEGLARQVHELLPHAAINWSTVEMWVPLEVIEPDEPPTTAGAVSAFSKDASSRKTG